jgi:8-oxo-dGTP diphosphatase
MSPLLASPRTRVASARRSAARRASYSVDVVLLTVQDGQLAVALVRSGGRPGERVRERWALPWATGTVDEPLGLAADRVAHEVLVHSPAWMEQIGAFGDGRRHPGGGDISVAYVGLVPVGTTLPGDNEAEFFPVSDLPAISPRQRMMVDAAVGLARARVGTAPVAFRLLPPTFTLSELQEMYELLLDRRLHKASFRRSLQAARIVEPTDEWRSEGRGRPAQLFRYAPRRRRTTPRGVRFE